MFPLVPTKILDKQGMAVVVVWRGGDSMVVLPLESCKSSLTVRFIAMPLNCQDIYFYFYRNEAL